MSKRPGSKASRSERRAGAERALRAKERGLPERPPTPPRQPVRASSAEAASQLERPAAGARQASKSVPSWLWVVGVALLLLAFAYWLSVRRDQALAPASAASTSAAKPAAP